MPVNDSGRIPIENLKLRKYASGPLIWGKKLTLEERNVVKYAANQILTDPDYLMACMAWESDRTFSPATRNKKSGATGPIQIMKDTVRLTPEIYRYCENKMELSFLNEADFKQRVNKAMDVIAGMTFVEYTYHVTIPYFKPYRGRIETLCDLYMSILYPKAIGKGEDFKIFVNDPDRYRDVYDMNNGLDADKNGIISKREACSVVRRMYEEGKKWME